ncbi:MAG TPA: hypothetical protein VFX60_18950, partial [Micromonospora sp.]|nr:hypothetical protein [Micromonospora sp.]
DIDPDAIPPWPHHPAEPLRPIVGPAYLRWLATHETAVAWVPTIGEAVGAYVDQVTDVRRRERQAEELARYGRVLTPDERTRRNDREFDRVQRAARCAASSAQR